MQGFFSFVQYILAHGLKLGLKMCLLFLVHNLLSRCFL
jgi:hypothetical protein